MAWLVLIIDALTAVWLMTAELVLASKSGELVASIKAIPLRLRSLHLQMQSADGFSTACI